MGAGRRVSNVTATALPLWCNPLVWGLGLLLLLYCAAIWFDLPTPAGYTYRQDLPVETLTNWGVQTDPNAPPAARFWDKAQGLRGWSVYPEGWFWARIEAAPFDRWLPVLLLSLLAVAGLFLTRSYTPKRRFHVLALAAMFTFAYALQLATLGLKHPSGQLLLFARIVDSNFTGYFTSALQITNITAFFSGYGDTITSETFCGHCRTHPPAPVLFYWLLERGAAALPLEWQQGLRDALFSLGNIPSSELAPSAAISALLGANIILLASAAIVLPLFGLARRMAGPAAAVPLAVLGAVLPGLILMSPEFDQMFATFSAVLLYLSLRGLSAGRGGLWWGLGAGLFFAFCLYWSFGLWVLAVPVGAMAMAAATGALGASPPPAGTAHLPIKIAFLWLAAFALGTAVPWLLLWGPGGFDLLMVLQVASNVHLNGITTVRPYGPWLVFNLIDFLQFVGLPLVVVSLLVFGRRVPAPKVVGVSSDSAVGVGGGAYANPRFAVEPNVYAAIFWAVLLALNISGTARAEVGRLWIFLSPLALLAVYRAVARGWLARAHIYLIFIAQLIICVLMGAFWLTP